MKEISRWIVSSIRQLGMVPACFFAVHMIASKGFGAYLTFPWLDIPMHFFGGVAIAYFIFGSIKNTLAKEALGELTKSGEYLLAFSGVCAAALVWEFAEWSTDRIGITQAQLSLEDTILDMFLGVAGGSIYLLLRSRIGKR